MKIHLLDIIWYYQKSSFDSLSILAFSKSNFQLQSVTRKTIACTILIFLETNTSAICKVFLDYLFSLILIVFTTYISSSSILKLVAVLLVMRLVFFIFNHNLILFTILDFSYKRLLLLKLCHQHWAGYLCFSY